MKKKREDLENIAGNRREFLKTAALATAAFSIVPREVLGRGFVAPSDKLNIAGIGVGGRGHGVLKGLASENIIALADVDFKKASGCFETFPKAKQYKDFRKMLEAESKNIDAVVIGTPDHTHAIATLSVLDLNKHVYVEKPLTHSVYESRMLTEYSAKKGVVTQMGNQGSSGDGTRQMSEWIWDGAIGEIKEVHTWTNRPIWPQGLQRPTQEQVPAPTLDWDLFIGPAKFRPYNEAYHPWNWRAWWDFGTGALGDMACHILEPVFASLKLRYPIAIEGSSTPINSESAPHAQKVTYYFPQREKIGKVAMPAVTVHWYDGGLLPTRPVGLPDGAVLGDRDGGVLFIGSKGMISCGCYGKEPKLWPEELDKNYTKPAPTLRRITTSHEMDWVRACKEPKKSRIEPASNFAIAGPFNETVVLGVLAVRLQNLRRILQWDGINMKFTNISASDKLDVVTTDEFSIKDGHPTFGTKKDNVDALAFANELIRHTPRKGWEHPLL